jgi:hypothetical protein
MTPEYINEALVHWTGREKSEAEAFIILKAICEERVLRLTYCPNYLQTDFQLKTAMVCFTDLPLSSSKIHCSTFGRFGIAFQKKAMIEYGANPVFYTTQKHFERIKQIAGLLNGMKDLERDREWRGESEHYHFSEAQTVSLLEVMGFLQEYSYKNDDSFITTYHQREWRLTFESLPFTRESAPHAPGMSCFYIRNSTSYPIFKFKDSDVSYLVLPRTFKEEGTEIARTIRCGVKIYEDEVNV